MPAVHRRPDRLGRDRRAHHREPEPPPARLGPVLPGRLQERHRRRRQGRGRRDARRARAARLHGHDQDGPGGDLRDPRQRRLPRDPARRAARPTTTPRSVEAACAALRAAGLREQVMIDFSHANAASSTGARSRSRATWRRRSPRGERRIVGVMIESHLRRGPPGPGARRAARSTASRSPMPASAWRRPRSCCRASLARWRRDEHRAPSEQRQFRVAGNALWASRESGGRHSIRVDGEPAMNKAFTREADGDGDDDGDDEVAAPALPAGTQNYLTPAGYAAAARGAADAARRRAAEGRRGRVLGGQERRPLGERRLPLRQEAPARDRPPHPLPDQRLDIAEVADPSLHHGSDQVFFGATVTYVNQRGEERTDHDQGHRRGRQPAGRGQLDRRRSRARC